MTMISHTTTLKTARNNAVMKKKEKKVAKKEKKTGRQMGRPIGKSLASSVSNVNAPILCCRGDAARLSRPVNVVEAQHIILAEAVVVDDVLVFEI